MEVAFAHIAGGHQQGVVRKYQHARTVVDTARRDVVEDDLFVHQLSAIPSETAQLLATGPCRTGAVYDVHVRVGVKVGMEAHAQHAAFARTAAHDRLLEDFGVGAGLGVDAEHFARTGAAPNVVIRTPEDFPRQVNTGGQVVFGEGGTAHLPGALLGYRRQCQYSRAER